MRSSPSRRIVPILGARCFSLFVHTPSVTELKADGSYLFNVIYPLFGLLMLGSYFAAMYYGFRFAASKVSYRTLKQTSDFRIATELALVLAAGLVFDVYLMFSMELRSEFWYVAALIASFTGVVDKDEPAGHRFRTGFAAKLFHAGRIDAAYSRHRRRRDARAHRRRVSSGLLRPPAGR